VKQNWGASNNFEIIVHSSQCKIKKSTLVKQNWGQHIYPMSFSLSISHGSHPSFEITKFLQASIVTQYDAANSVVSFYDYLTIDLTRFKNTIFVSNEQYRISMCRLGLFTFYRRLRTKGHRRIFVIISVMMKLNYAIWTSLVAGRETRNGC
jgi:hypothetical protein